MGLYGLLQGLVLLLLLAEDVKQKWELRGVHIWPLTVLQASNPIILFVTTALKIKNA
jgi:hypothetical protein